MTKTVWVYDEREFNSEEDARLAVGKNAEEHIEYEMSYFIEWFNYQYDGCEFGRNYSYEAYEVAEAMGVDFTDFLEDYADHIFETEVEEEEVEVECDYIFNGEKYSTRHDAEIAVIDYANGGAFNDTLDSDVAITIGYNNDTRYTFSRSAILFKMDEAAYWACFAAYCDDLKKYHIVEVEREGDDE